MANQEGAPPQLRLPDPSRGCIYPTAPTYHSGSPPTWVDAKISQLAVLLFEAQDLARSPAGWIKTSGLTKSLSRRSFSLLPSASLPRDQKRFGPSNLLLPHPPLPPLLPLLSHILIPLAPHSRTLGPMFAFRLTYTLPQLPSFLLRMMTTV